MMKKAVIQLETLTCPSCALKIQGALKALPGVGKESIQVLFNSSKVKLDFEEKDLSLEEITKAITPVGYTVLKAQEK